MITGSIDGGGDVDMFQFSAKKNETIVFEVQAARTGSKLDSSLRVFDMTGKVLAHDEDTNDLDSLIAFHPPQDGEFLLQIRDLRYMGGKDYPYRIVAGPTPYIESVFPPGGQNGTTVEVKPRGYNLEGIAKIPVDVKGYRPSLSHSMKIHGESAAGRSNDVLFDVSDFPEINEAEPNDTVAAANAVSISAKARGIVINGQIGKPKDADYFRFAAIKGHKLSFEIAPGRIGSPIDPLLILFNAKGDFLQQDDVNGKFERGFDADGDFIICVRDLHDRGGPEYPYRLVIREPVPIPTFSVTYTPIAHVYTAAGIPNCGATWFAKTATQKTSRSISIICPKASPPKNMCRRQKIQTAACSFCTQRKTRKSVHCRFRFPSKDSANSKTPRTRRAAVIFWNRSTKRKPCSAHIFRFWKPRRSPLRR